MRPHLMLFTMNSRHQVVLISYETPRHVNQEDFVYSDSFRLDYRELTASHIFTPLVYQYSDGAFQGANESMFAPAVKFATARKIGKDGLVIKETMERNGRKTFGFDEPIMYRRVE